MASRPLVHEPAARPHYVDVKEAGRTAEGFAGSAHALRDRAYADELKRAELVIVDLAEEFLVGGRFAAQIDQRPADDIDPEGQPLARDNLSR
jgi:hypothetical protein